MGPKIRRKSKLIAEKQYSAQLLVEVRDPEPLAAHSLSSCSPALLGVGLGIELSSAGGLSSCAGGSCREAVQEEGLCCWAWGLPWQLLQY